MPVPGRRVSRLTAIRRKYRGVETSHETIPRAEKKRKGKERKRIKITNDGESKRERANGDDDESVH